MPAKKTLQIAVLFGLGAFLLQSAWILAVPPYRGIDEFDHAYRANSVAEGYWRTWDKPENGRGDLIPVRRSIIQDGKEICRSYNYTGPDNCRAVDYLGHGMATVASAASRYHPAYYWVIGLPSLFVEGAGALYAMRWLSALICAGLIAASSALLAQRYPSPWPLAGFALSLTPVLVYSSSLPAPNAVEMLAGAGLWIATASLATGTRSRRSHLTFAIACSVVLITVRPLGVLWWLLIVGSSVVAFGAAQLRVSLSRHRTTVALGFMAISATLVAAVAWYWGARTYDIPAPQIRESELNRWTVGLTEIPIWLAQTIAAFPMRNQAAPSVVYALIACAFLAIAIAAFVVIDMRGRIALSFVAVGSIAVGYGFTFLTVMQYGTNWQGRYALPYAMGIAILSGILLTQSSRLVPLAIPLARVLGLGVAAAHVISIIAVQSNELRTSPLAGDERWIQPSLLFTGTLAGLGVLAWYLAVFWMIRSEGAVTSEPRGSSQSLPRTGST